ncbi:hypothetical protein CROQUDRAFT_654492 [Cronartium quercuum f. sp. fusiforme G11]|uniref:Uncharacterized protein n=1 Tax=Cronartium quercuum f. sp. fusiforme G11 TaxID=708437 RepID=A0A9P6T4V5_9BASI|nr:hypothetical protein CROQUDRAFT_666927 [Cronartium quercuum f. sp. fusiforme G11]KAG0148658.1 hypothetical protein CROQUDRAFT_654492 [Cronartium quercuum f. sp. fusiforme G11]
MPDLSYQGEFYLTGKLGIERYRYVTLSFLHDWPFSESPTNKQTVIVRSILSQLCNSITF